MRLKRLELLGFKSFADRTVFEFGDDTLTGVVGPNGCGKSNVVDAMRWVLGEQRPTSMRGKEMTDVIFKGCASRPGMGFAECTIILDNSMGTIPDQGPEIAVTRRVFKSGEGEYRLDDQKVRLKDIKEMLFDTGLGSRGYSVLEQGRIDAVLSANPIDRRRIFEEAAGISRYRQRKHETELRLSRVEQDLTRLDDVTGELRSRVRSLKIQAGKAERYVEARGQWELEKTRLVKHQLHGLGEELDACIVKLSELEAQLETMRTEREGSDEQIQQLEAHRASLQEQVEEVAREATRLEGDARAVEERRTQLLARVQSWEHAARDEEQRVQDLTGQLSERASELAVLEQQKAALDGEVAAAREAAERQAGARRELNKEYAEARTRAQEQNELVLGHLHEKTAAQNTQRHLEESRGPSEERFARVEQRLGEAREQLGRVQSEEEGATVELAAAEAAQSSAQAALAGLEGELRALETKLSSTESERNELALEIARHSSRIESLLDRDRELKDLGAGAKAVLEAAAGPDGPCPADHLAGLLADHLATSTEHARALDAVLGERAAALVARDADVARDVARWLSGSNQGQAALTIVGGLGTPGASPAAQLPADIACKVRGELRAVVDCDPGFAGVAASLFGDVLLVDDLETAFAVVSQVPGRRCVTPDGEVVDASGLVAGVRTLAQGAIGRRSSAAELQAEVHDLEQRGELLSTELEELGEQRRELRARFESAGTEVQAKRDDASAAYGRLRTAQARVRDLGASLELLERESAGVIQEREKLAADLVTAARRVHESQAAFERENQVLQELEARRHQLEQDREVVLREENRARVEETRLEEQLGALSTRITDLTRTREQNENEARRAERLSREAAESAALGSAESEQLAEQSRALSAARGEIDGRLTTLREDVAAAGAELEGCRRERDAVTRLLEGRANELSSLRLDEQRIGLAREEVLRRAEEELALEPEGLLEGFEPEEELLQRAQLDALDRRVRDLKGQLDRLGPVNMEALGELEEVGGRLEFLEGQIGDLVQSRKVLNDTLKKIEEESERLFVKTFDEVRGNFQRIFRQLFGGGKADVKLAEGEPVLEAGVEISARPPGREMLPIGMLSGGQRTMTALALLFAVFEARPSPFCVLDEVDAALDDANIQRFLGMLNLFRRSTQFVVVTHNKGTMAASDSLYGVTMQTKGVSRQVSVQIEEVDEFVPEATGKQDKGDAPALSVSDAFGEDTSIEDPGEEPEIDAESGERIVELVPATAEAQPEAEASAESEVSEPSADELTVESGEPRA
jgi:chromosome segregation protein